MKLRDRKARKGMFGPAAFLWKKAAPGIKSTIRSGRFRCFVSASDYDFVLHKIQAAELPRIFGLDSHDIYKGQLVRLDADVCYVAAQKSVAVRPLLIYG